MVCFRRGEREGKFCLNQVTLLILATEILKHMTLKAKKEQGGKDLELEHMVLL